MDFEFGEEIRAIQDMARKFAQNEILPRVGEDEKVFWLSLAGRIRGIKPWISGSCYRN